MTKKRLLVVSGLLLALLRIGLGVAALDEYDRDDSGKTQPVASS